MGGLFCDKRFCYVVFCYLKPVCVLFCSVSLLLTTTEAAVVDKPNEKKPPSRVPDMDALGGY